MKKFLIALLILFVLFIGALIAIPIVFKDKLVAYVKEAANEQLDATVDFGEFDLSLIRSFPNFSFRINDVTVDGHNQFEGVRLAEVGTLEFTLALMPLLNDEVMIRELGISNSSFDVRVLEDESANYNIMKESEEEVEEVVEESGDSEFNVALQRYFFKNVNVRYYDIPLLTDVIIEGLDHEGSGDFTQDFYTLRTTTSIASLKVIYDGITYLKNVKANAEMDIDIDAVNSKYTLKENEIELNELHLGVDGWLAMPEDPIDMDITFYGKRAEFREILSLVPAEFAGDLEGVDITGGFALNGFARGVYDDDNYPAFGLDMKVDNGRFKYPDLPASADNIAVDCKIDHPGGDLDRMVIDLSRFHVEMAGNPIDMKLLLKTPMSDPDIDASVKAALDFANLAKVVPMEEEMSGSFDADLNFKGRYSAIEEERYDDFHAAGTLALRNFEYHEEDGYNVFINEADFSFNPQYAELSQLNMRMEGMDMAMQGRLENYIAYALKDSTISGELNLQSKKIDLNAFMDDEEVASEESEETESEEEYAAFEIPDNIRFDVNATIDELIYDDLTIGNVNGNIRVANQIVSMNNVNMDVLEGKVLLNGAYNAQNPQKPKADFAFDARNLDIQKTATSFVTVEKFAPLAKNATGKFSTKMTFKTDLDEKLDPILESVYGKGSLESKNVFIEGFEPLNELAKTLKIDRLAKQNIEDVKLSFEILNGRAYVQPFDIKIDQINTNIAGSTGLDQTLDYAMKMKVPTKMLEGGAMDMVTGLMGQAAGLLGQEFKMGDNIDVDILVGGTVEKPTFRPSFGGMGGDKSPTDMVKDKIKEEMDKAKDEMVGKAVEEAREQAAKLISEAEKQGNQLRSEAKKQADRVRAEGRSAAKKLEDEANNPITKAAARKAGEKLIQEADNNAAKIESEADKQARKIVDEAKRQGDKLISNAEAAVN